MRANVEDTDLSSYKLRLAAAYIDEYGIKLSSEHAVLGVMVRIWYHAVNDKKRKVSLGDLSKYLLIVNNEAIQKLADCLVQSEYLKFDPADGMYEIVGKDKDYAQKLTNEEISRLNNEVKKQKAIEKLNKKLPQTLTPQTPRTEPSTVPPTVSSTEPSVEPGTESSVVPSTGPHALQDKTLQDMHNKTKETAEPDAEAADRFFAETKAKLLPSPTAQVVSLDKVEIVEAEKAPVKTVPLEKRGVKNENNAMSKVYDHYQNLWKVRMKATKAPGFAGRDFAIAKEILDTLGGDLNRMLHLMTLYFQWGLPEVIKAGYPFSKGYSSFHHKLVELMADESNLARRADAEIAAGRLKRAESKVKDEERANRILKEGENEPPTLPA